MHNIFLIFPHQLFKDISLLKQADEVYLIEEYLFFKQYKFHKQKLLLHRASMKNYENYLIENGIKVSYIDSITASSDISVLISELKDKSNILIQFYDVADNWLNKRIAETGLKNNIKTQEFSSALFINTKKELEQYFELKQKYFQTDFYTQQRKKLNILIDENGKPEGGKWSYDADNRLKYPKDKMAPSIKFPPINRYYSEAVDYVEKNFSENYGFINTNNLYPVTHDDAELWLQEFLKSRFDEFGKYEDAIVANENILHHSVLTPMLNIGLLTPKQIIESTLSFSAINNIPLNSLEGFIRQIIGWREFIRGVYVYKGTQERNRNFLNYTKKIPTSFYNGTTGVEPIDTTIKKILQTGYCHHIERLMILGNFMLLCEFHPDEVYKWFMELFIDAYDWVMVPNVYGMSQFADGGLMASKPYISGSSYVLKMSNYKKGNWCMIWDALFWNFMNKHRTFLKSNPRLAMLISTYDKMSDEKKNAMSKIQFPA